jgi:hypothetical protein
MKKLIAIFLITALVVCCSLSVSAATVYRYGNWSLTALNTDGNIAFAVRSYDGSDAVVTVPNDYGGYPIIAIDAYAFAGNKTLQEVTIGDNITGIGEGAFMQCSALTKINVPDSVAEIGENAFSGSENTVICGTADSYAVEYAKEHEIDYIRTNVVTYILGDADGDGVITAIDATLVLRYLVKLSVPNIEIVERNGDIDGEGLDITDATLILRHVIEADVPYPIGSLVEQIL